jgi:hypothetical protein
MNNVLISHAPDKNMLSHTAQIITYKNFNITVKLVSRTGNI